MTMLKIFDGLDSMGRPTFRSEHPFLVLGPNPKSDHRFTDYQKIGDRMRHVVIKTRSVNRLVIYRKGGPRRETVPASWNRNSTTSRQVRRQLAREHAKFIAQGG